MVGLCIAQGVAQSESVRSVVGSGQTKGAAGARAHALRQHITHRPEPR